MRRSTPLLPRPAALVCAAMFLLFTIPGQAQPLPLSTRHVRDAVVNGQAQFVGKLPATQTLLFDMVLPLRDRAGLQNFVQRSSRSDKPLLPPVPYAAGIYREVRPQPGRLGRPGCFRESERL